MKKLLNDKLLINMAITSMVVLGIVTLFWIWA